MVGHRARADDRDIQIMTNMVSEVIEDVQKELIGGRCRSFETEKQFRKRLKHDIEMLNKTETAGCAGADKASQEQSFRGLRENDLREADSDNSNGIKDPANT